MPIQMELLDYRRAVAAIYAGVRAGAHAPAEAWHDFRRTRDRLFRAHPQSPLSESQRAVFTSLPYFDYDPAFRFLLPVDWEVDRERFEVELQEDGKFIMERIGRIHFTVGDESLSLSLFWILGYGGGLFLPFRDATSGQESYGGGRYLLDTIKHADLGQDGERLVIDFNFAYNPSCAYNPRWHCPLAPPENWLPVAISAGEKQELQ